jgi:hypothetical protein
MDKKKSITQLINKLKKALKNREKLAEKYINKYEKFLDGENK